MKFGVCRLHDKKANSIAAYNVAILMSMCKFTSGLQWPVLEDLWSADSVNLECAFQVCCKNKKNKKSNKKQ